MHDMFSQASHVPGWALCSHDKVLGIRKMLFPPDDQRPSLLVFCHIPQILLQFPTDCIKLAFTTSSFRPNLSLPGVYHHHQQAAAIITAVIIIILVTTTLI